MNDRSGRRPTLAPDDDPSIPVLTERLALPVAGARPPSPSASPLSSPSPAAKAPVAPPPPVPRSADGVVDSMVFPPAAPARKPEAALPVFDLPPIPAPAPAPKAVAQATAAQTGVAAPTSFATAAPSAAPAAPAAPPDADAIRNAILDDLAARLPREVESLMRRQLAGSIEAAVQAATTDLAARIRNAAAQSLQNLVEQSVKAEIARLRPPPKR
jgi:hypothetical protein